ncbi:MAG: ASKHA domain-containing protein, partial [Eubacteriales bacterium]
VIYSGNTTMIHLATNVDPTSLGKFPYTPKIRGGNDIPADMLDISPFGLVYLPPIISSYVGPDITSGVLASQIEKKKGTTLFIDIGTNGEMVIAKDGSLSATSTAAGPAFEGMNITYGMRAGKGALEMFQIDDGGNIETHTIGDVKATGICGSGLLDIVGELVKTGVVGPNGKIIPPEKGSYPENLKQYVVSFEGKPAFRVTDDVYLTQKDVRQVQLAKGAVRAGIEAFLLSQNVRAEDVDLVEIAGSFGYHLRAKSLINIGLLPKEFEGKVSFVGNTSKSGGKAFLLNTDLRRYMEELVGKIDSVELSNREGFNKIFVNALNF